MKNTQRSRLLMGRPRSSDTDLKLSLGKASMLLLPVSEQSFKGAGGSGWA